MANITGSYAFHGSGYTGLEIVAVSSGSGTLDAVLIDAQFNKTTIHGTYDAANNKIDFNDASFPGLVLNTIFFTGFAIVDPGTGEVIALAGTWGETIFHFDPSRKLVRVQRKNGAWY